ncbi:hypothetical protein PMAYCL1PPCAC_01958, partial [Pristionchus mayeri]
FRMHRDGRDYDYYSDKKYLKSPGLLRCSRTVSDLKQEDKDKMLNETKTDSSSELAWVCAAGTVCCDWECCKDPNAEEEGLTTGQWVLISIGIFIGVLILIGCCCWLV